MLRPCHLWPLLAVLALGCGAKTGLLIPDAGMDAGRFDDAGPVECETRRIALSRRRAEVYFAIDSSGSMLETFDGQNADPVEESRWYLLRESLDAALAVQDEDLSSGALFFPDVVPGADDGCVIEPGLDIPVRPSNAGAILAEFDLRGLPVGGTPTAAALLAIRDELLAAGPTEVTRFVILATDGAPNCNADPPIPPPMCFCTHPDPMVCARAREQNCLDDEAAIAAVTELSELGVPVYVLGLTDPDSAPILGEVLDRMAVAGGRARPTGDRRFYDIRSAEELSGTMNEITNSVSRCTLYLDPGSELREDDVLEIGGERVPRDRTRTNGWDLTDPARGEITLFGDACGLIADGAALAACVLPL